jgi:hypothetical protein
VRSKTRRTFGKENKMHVKCKPANIKEEDNSEDLIIDGRTGCSARLL